MDLTARRISLAALPAYPPSGADGRIKQLLIARALAVRKKIPQLFSTGQYRPVEIVGASADNVVGFARVLRDCAAITLFYRFTAQLLGSETLNMSSLCDKGTRLLMPRELQGTFADALLADELVSIGPEVDLGQIFRRLPVALLIKAPDNRPPQHFEELVYK